MNADERFRHNVRLIRQKQNMDQGQLALRLGCARAYVSDMERGRSSLTLRKVEQVAQALGVDVMTLFKKPSAVKEEVAP